MVILAWVGRRVAKAILDFAHGRGLGLSPNLSYNERHRGISGIQQLPAFCGPDHLARYV